LTLSTKAGSVCWNGAPELRHDIMNPGIVEMGRWPNILGEKERRCRNATDSKLIDFSPLSYIKEKK